MRVGPCYIYVIGRAEGPVKIGHSFDPDFRIGKLQTGCPFKISVLATGLMHSKPHAIQHERSFQKKFSKKRLTGEWFDLSAATAIRAINAGLKSDRRCG